MLYIHSADPIHRDLKSRNIMISDTMRGKVADYGDARIEDTSKTMTSTGTALWMAPEVATASRYNTKADVYSFGVILYEITKRDLPYRDREGMNPMGLAVEVGKGLRPTIEEDWRPSLKALMKDWYVFVMPHDDELGNGLK